MAEGEGNDSADVRRLAIDLEALTLAMESQSGEVDWYLDLETGDLVMVTSEARSLLEDAYEGLGDRDGVTRADLAAALERSGGPEWQREFAIQVDEVERGDGVRFVPVPPTESWRGYADMEEFIATLDDEVLRERLSDAIRGRGAFGRFKDVLSRSGEMLDVWYAFKNARERARALRWLESEGIEATPRRAGGSPA